MAAITRILIPIDFGVHSELAFNYGTAFARRFDAAVELLHVVEDPFAGGIWSSEIHIRNIVELQEKFVAEATRRLADFQAASEEGGVTIERTVLSGQAAPTIVAHARATGADLIVMGTHGRTRLPHLFVGSVAERVVRTAECPVLTVREPGVSAEREEPRQAEGAA